MNFPANFSLQKIKECNFFSRILKPPPRRRTIISISKSECRNPRGSLMPCSHSLFERPSQFCFKKTFVHTYFLRPNKNMCSHEINRVSKAVKVVVPCMTSQHRTNIFSTIVSNNFFCDCCSFFPIFYATHPGIKTVL